MWLFTKDGFYSAVEDRRDERFVWVRARREEDLEVLGFKSREIIFKEKADYPFRVRMKKGRWGAILAQKSTEITYPNFKSAVAALDKRRADIYMRVWSVMLSLEHEADDLLDDEPEGLFDDYDAQEQWFHDYLDEIEDIDDDGVPSWTPRRRDARLFDDIHNRYDT